MYGKVFLSTEYQKSRHDNSGGVGTIDQVDTRTFRNPKLDEIDPLMCLPKTTIFHSVP